MSTSGVSNSPGETLNREALQPSVRTRGWEHAPKLSPDTAGWHLGASQADPAPGTTGMPRACAVSLTERLVSGNWGNQACDTAMRERPESLGTTDTHFAMLKRKEKGGIGIFKRPALHTLRGPISCVRPTWASYKTALIGGQDKEVQLQKVKLEASLQAFLFQK